MGLCGVYRFLIRGLIALLLVNYVALSTVEKNFKLTSGVQAEANHLRSLGRIVNGSAATLTQFPHLVSLRNTLTDGHFCGGNIIRDEWILTAAHCLFQRSGAQRPPWLITVVAGDIWLNRVSETSQRSAVNQAIIHEDYDALTYENDIALLKLATTLTFKNRAVQQQRLQTQPVPAGTICQVAGWGYPAADIPVLMNELMYVDVPIMSLALCRELYAKFSDIPDGMICAGYTEGLRDACQGDSGGGLICDGTLTGIVSWGEECAWPNYPGVYADVYYYRSWVLEWIEKDFGNGNGANEAKFSLWTKLLLLVVTGFVYTS